MLNYYMLLEINSILLSKNTGFLCERQKYPANPQKRCTKIKPVITHPFVPRRYQFEEMFLHWSPEPSRSASRASAGSEHSINGHFFPAEIQLYGFNAHLFNNLSEAMQQPHGVVAVSIMVQESDRKENTGLKAITSHLKKVKR